MWMANGVQFPPYGGGILAYDVATRTPPERSVDTSWTLPLFRTDREAWLRTVPPCGWPAARTARSGNPGPQAADGAARSRPRPRLDDGNVQRPGSNTRRRSRPHAAQNPPRGRCGRARDPAARGHGGGQRKHSGPRMAPADAPILRRGHQGDPPRARGSTRAVARRGTLEQQLCARGPTRNPHVLAWPWHAARRTGTDWTGGHRRDS